MRINIQKLIINNTRRTSKAFTLITAVLITFSFVGSLSAKEDVDKLKKSLKQQECEILKKNKSKSVAKKGYTCRTKKSNVRKTETIKAVNVEVVPDLKSLYREAKELYALGKYDEAKNNLEIILEENPLHIPTKRLLKLVIDTQNELLGKDVRALAKERMLDVDRAWLPPKKDKDKGQQPELAEGKKSQQQIVMDQKIKQVIPEINFTDAHIRDVLKYLSEVSGINIVVDEGLFPKSSGASLPDEVELTDEGETAELGQGTQHISAGITISLTNIPLIEALKYILSVKGLKYKIDEYAIVVTTPERLAEVEMETRYYHLIAGAGIFTEFAKKIKGDDDDDSIQHGASKGLEEKKQITIKDVMEQSGIPFPKGSKVFLDQRTGTLIVRNTPINLKLVEEILRMLDIAPFQVEIEARFVEINEDIVKELGMEWMITNDNYTFGGSDYRLDSDTTSVLGQFPDSVTDSVTGREGITNGLRFKEYTDNWHISDYPYSTPSPQGNVLSISGVLSKPEFRMILHALDQSGFADVLSAPKITTLNNQQAQIEIVDEIIYPTEFELIPSTTNDAGNVVTQPAVTPSTYVTRDVGIVLNVTPSVGADRKTITLTLNPEVSELMAWKDYGISRGANWNSIPILQPVFFTKNVMTNIVLHDGETVVMGGLIQEHQTVIDDKIPVLGDIPILGRMFRSKVEATHKTNLLIFVTANLLTPAGDRIRE